ncbi:MAG: IPT/TIG domain-containing protein [Acidobacteriota bacterium]
MLIYQLLASLCVFACLVSAQDFYTGQAARLIIGQKSFTAQFPGNSDEILGAVGGIAVAGNKLYVADSSRIGASPANHRVVIFDNLDQTVPRPEDRPVQGARCPACVGKASMVLGQPNFNVKPENMFPSRVAANTMRLATAVASDGRVLAVADTDFNRVLIWRNIPSSNGQPADVVIGQESLDRLRPIATDNKSLRGPQGVWVQDGRLFVADTQNHRVLIWNRIPTSNDQPADIVLGQPNFTTVPQVDISRATFDPKQNNLLNPVSVTSDGRRLYVADLGHNRVLVWNTIPTSNQAPADLVLGQPDFTSAVANNTTKLCAATGKDNDGKDTFPGRCGATMNFPRFALSDGRRLFIADGGNDRVLVYNTIPTANGAKADVVLGQRSDSLNLTSDGAFPNFVSAADVIRTPTSLATDGQNLYVADPYNRRVLVFTPGPKLIGDTGVRNAASREIFAVGNIVFAGTPTENETIRVRVNYDEKDKDNTQYEYKIPKDGTLAAALNELVVLINTRNGCNKNVIATPLIRPGFVVMLLTARTSGEAGNQVAVAAEVLPAKEGETAKTAVTVSGANLAGGQDAAQIAAGSIVTILGDNFTDETETRSVPLTASFWPRGLANVEVFFDGISAPIQSVSKTQIVAQLPIELRDTSGTNCWVRTVRRDGSITFSVPVGVPVILQNPGIFAEEGVDPRPGIITHYSSAATATISIDGTAKANDVATVVINGREYSYTVQAADVVTDQPTAANFVVRDKLVELINARDTEVEAFRSGFFTRLRLRSKKLGPDGNGLPIAVKTNSDAGVILTAFNNELCCANVAGARVTEENPAVPGETIVLLATGLGDILPDSANGIFFTGIGFEGPEFNEPKEFVSSLAGGKTANVLFAGLRPGLIGLYEVHLELNTDLDTNPRTQVTIAQSFQVSNIVTFALKNVKKDAGIQ